MKTEVRPAQSVVRTRLDGYLSAQTDPAPEQLERFYRQLQDEYQVAPEVVRFVQMQIGNLLTDLRADLADIWRRMDELEAQQTSGDG